MGNVKRRGPFERARARLISGYKPLMLREKDQGMRTRIIAIAGLAALRGALLTASTVSA